MPPKDQLSIRTHSKLTGLRDSTVLKTPISSNEDFIKARISERERKIILAVLKKYKRQFYQELATKSAKEAIHKTKHDIPELPRSIMIYKNPQEELVCLVQLKAHLPDGQEAAIKGDKEHLYIGVGGFRVIKFLLDITSDDIYAETINKGKDQDSELAILKEVDSPYINRLICFAQYKNSKGEQVTITVSPYQKHGVISDAILTRISMQQKIMLVLQILLGVKTIHDGECCHNDLKLLNILFQNDLSPLIIDLDFLAKEQPSESGPATIPYVSPEMASQCSYLYAPYVAFKVQSRFNIFHQKPFCHRANDIWALGVLIYQIANNSQYPTLDFVVNEPTKKESILNKLAHSMLRPIRENRPDINKAIVTLMIYLAYVKFQDKITEIKKVGESTDSNDDVRIFEVIFREFSELFFDFSLGLQKSIVAGLNRYGHFKHYHIDNFPKRQTALGRKFTRSEIISILTDGNGMNISEYRVKLKDLRKFFSDNNDTYILSRDGGVNFNEILLDHYINKNNRFDPFMNFIMFHAQFINFSLLGFLEKLEGAEREVFLKSQMERGFLQECLIFILRDFADIPLNLGRAKILFDTFWLFISLYENRISISNLDKFIDCVSTKILPYCNGFDAERKNKLQNLLFNNYESILGKVSLSVLVERLCVERSDIFNLLTKFLELNKFTSQEQLEFILALGKKAKTFKPNTNLDLTSINVTLWTDNHYNIIHAMECAEELPDDKALIYLDKLFGILQENHTALYPQRNPSWDSITSFLVRAPVITDRRYDQLGLLRAEAFKHLERATGTLGTVQQKRNLLNTYQSQPLFSFHRKRGLFNGMRPTDHQQRIENLKNQLTPVASGPR